MSELHDDDIARFMAEESSNQVLAAEIETQKVAFLTDFYEYLDANEIDHACSLDPVADKQYYESLVTIFEEDEGVSRTEAAIAATEMRTQEKALAETIASLKILENYGFNQAFISLRKKQVQARLMILQFPKGWIDAINDLTVGAPLDLTQDHDISLYSSLAIEVMSHRRSPLAERIGEIVIGHEGDLAPEDPLRLERYQLAIDVLSEMIRAEDPFNIPTVRAQIDEFVRLGRLNADQAAALNDTIDNPPGRTGAE